MTLFKRNYHHVVSDAYFKAYHTVARGNPNYFITYGNGKSAARVQSGLRPNGAHRWYSYVKAPKCAPTWVGLFSQHAPVFPHAWPSARWLRTWAGEAPGSCPPAERHLECLPCSAQKHATAETC